MTEFKKGAEAQKQAIILEVCYWCREAEEEYTHVPCAVLSPNDMWVHKFIDCTVDCMAHNIRCVALVEENQP